MKTPRQLIASLALASLCIFTADACAVTRSVFKDTETGAIIEDFNTGTKKITFSSGGSVEFVNGVNIIGVDVLRAALGITNVENVAFSTWGGSSSLNTLGVVNTGTWQADVIAPAYLGSGSGITTKFLRGDGTWQTISSGITIDSTAVSGGTDGNLLAIVSGKVGQIVTSTDMQSFLVSLNYSGMRAALGLGASDNPRWVGVTIGNGGSTGPFVSNAINFATGASYYATLSNTTLTANRSWSLPDVSGTIITTGNLSAIVATGTVTSGTWSGSFGAVSGANLTSLNASNISSGSLALARIAQGGATSGQAMVWSGSAWVPTTLATTASNTFSGVQTLSAGTVSAPALTLGDATTGIYRSAADEVAVAIVGVQKMKVTADKTTVTGAASNGNVFTLVSPYGSTTFTVAGGGILYFNAGSNVYGAYISGAEPGNSTNYCRIGYDSSGVAGEVRSFNNLVEIGGSSATPVSQTLSGQRAVGTDIAGGNLNLGTTGTGTGSSGSINLQAHSAGSTGATAGTLVTKLSVGASGTTVGNSGAAIDAIKHGTAVLVAGTVTVTDAAVVETGTAATSSRIFVTRMTDGGTTGDSFTITRTNATSFTITAKTAGATQTLDTSTVSWLLINP